MSSFEQSVTLLRENKRSMVSALRSLGYDVSDDMKASEIPRYVRMSGGLLDVKVAALRERDGKKLYFSKEEWQEMSEAAGGLDGLLVRGVRVRADGLSFLIADENVNMPFGPAAASGLDMYNGAAGLYSVDSARQRTEAIFEAYKDKSNTPSNFAAKYCLEYMAYDGDDTKWALPTVGHLHVMYRYRNRIDEVLAVAFGTLRLLSSATFINVNFVSCVEFNAGSVWCVALSSGYTSQQTKTNALYVRAIADE